jgi:hypothetical protein
MALTRIASALPRHDNAPFEIPGVMMQQQKAENWLRQLGCNPTVTSSVDANEWQIQFVFPPGSQQTLACFAPKVPKGSTVISVNYPLGQGEAAFEILTEGQRIAFIQELRGMLSRDHLYHDISPGANPNSCPRSFAVFDMRFDDGVTLDSFARSIITVSNTALAANLCCARHLVPPRVTGTSTAQPQVQ